MILATICIHGVRATPVNVQPIPRGIVGGQVQFEYTDSMWAGLTNTVVFRAGNVTKDILNAGEVVDIPPEVVAEVGSILKVGVYGEGTPTLWADLGRVRDAADPSGDESTDPTPPVWAQLQEQIDELKENGVPGGAPGNAAQLVQQAVSQHNTSDDSHGDIRLELKAVSDRLTAFFDSDDQTLDELSEIVEYITSNKNLIEAVTTSKVSVSDIINNLVTNASNKPLSAAQGAVLKNLIDSVSNRLSDYQPKGDYLKRAELPSGAKVGQIVKIAEVDDKGIPSKWEAIDLPDSGGNAALTSDQITALHGMFKVCAFTKADVSAEYNAFKTAFGIEDSGEEEPDVPVIPPDEPDEPDIPEVTLTSISATYSGGDVAVGTAVTDLTGIVVTAHYSDGSTETVTGYTLSGEIAEGSNTVTVSYGSKTTTFTVTGVAESGGDSADIHDGYISDGLEFRLDAIRNSIDGHVSQMSGWWPDVSGNGYETYQVSQNGWFVVADTYMEVPSRGQVAIRDYTKLLGKMVNAFTVEAVYQTKAVNSTWETPVFSVGDNKANYLMTATGKFRVLGSDVSYGTAISNSGIRHCTLVYDGATLKMYHYGVLDAEVPATFDISTGSDAEFWGNAQHADPMVGTFNAARIYTRALTEDEIIANYNNDVTRFGTINEEVA